MLDKQVIIADFFGIVENNLMEVLSKLSHRESWQNYITGYEFPEDGDFENGIMIFMETSSYGEVLLTDIEFFSYLEVTCDEYIKNNAQEAEEVRKLLKKIELALNITRE